MSGISQKAIEARGGGEKRRYFVNKETEDAMRLEVAQLVQAAQRDYKGFISRLIGERPRNNGTRNVRFYSNNHLSVELSGPRAGSWHDHMSGKGGGPIQLVMYYLGCDFKGALTYMRRELGFPTPPWAQGRKARPEVQALSDQELNALVQSGERKRYERLKALYGPDHPSVREFLFSEFVNGKWTKRQALPEILVNGAWETLGPDDNGGGGGGGGGGTSAGDGGDDEAYEEADADDVDDAGDEDMEDDADAVAAPDFFHALASFTLPEQFVGVDLGSNPDALGDIEAITERENERKRQYARRLWSQTVPLTEPSGVWNYLKGRRIEGDRYPLPEDLRMSRDGLTMVAGYRNVSGEIVAVQKTPVTADGKKSPYTRLDDDGQVSYIPKKAFGRLSEGFTFLPGVASDASKVTIIAEGLETGLSLWHATHFDVVVVGGAIRPRKVRALGDQINGRTVLLARDDDASNNPASVSYLKTLRGLLEDGVTAREITPNRARRGDGSDFNDLLKAAEDRRSGLRKVQSRVRRGLAAKSRDRLSETLAAQDDLRGLLFGVIGQFKDHAEQKKAQANKRATWSRATGAAIKKGAEVTDISGLIDSDPPPPLQIGLPFGVGTNKTGISISVIRDIVEGLRASGDRRAVGFAVPQHRLGEEVMRRFAADAPGLNVKRWISKPVEVSERGAANKVHACLNYPSFAWKTEVGLEPSGLCEGCNGTCEHAQAYKAVELEAIDRDGQVDVWVMAHAACFAPELPKPIAENGIAVMFYDETVWPAAVKEQRNLTREDIDGPLVSERTEAEAGKDVPLRAVQIRQQDARLAMQKLLDLDVGTFITREHLIEAGLDYELARQAIGYEHRRKLTINEGDSALCADDFRPNTTIEPMADALALFAKALDPYRDPNDRRALGIEIIEEPPLGCDGKLVSTLPKVKKMAIRARRNLNDTLAAVPSVLLNGTLLQYMESFVFPLLVMARENVFTDVPHQHIYQVGDHSFYNGWLAGTETRGITAEEAERIASERHKVIAAVCQVMSIRTSRKVLLGTNVATRTSLQSDIEAMGGAVLNFGAVSGRDEFKAYTEVEVGRNQPSAEVVENIKMSLTGWAVARQAYVKADRPLKFFVDGRKPCDTIHKIGVQSDAHPDLVCEMIRWTKSEGEAEQFEARNRAMWMGTADNPLFCLKLAGHPGFRAVRGLLPFYEVTNPPVWARMLTEVGFVLGSRRDIRSVVGDAIRFDNSEGIYDRPQWPLHVVQRAYETTVGAEVPGLPSVFDSLVKVTYRTGNSGEKAAYCLADRLDDLKAAIHSLVQSEIVSTTIFGCVIPEAGAETGHETGHFGVQRGLAFYIDYLRKPDHVGLETGHSAVERGHWAFDPAAFAAGTIYAPLAAAGVLLPGVYGAKAVVEHLTGKSEKTVRRALAEGTHLQRALDKLAPPEKCNAVISHPDPAILRAGTEVPVRLTCKAAFLRLSEAGFEVNLKGAFAPVTAEEGLEVEPEPAEVALA